MRFTALSIGGAAFALAAPAWSQAPQARLTRVSEAVEVASPARHPAQLDEALSRGHTVRTRAGAAAEVTLADGSRLQLGENTTLLMFGSTGPVAPPARPVNTTALQRGALRALLPEPAPGASAASLPIATPAGEVLLGRGEATVHVDAARRVVRVAVHRGRARVRLAGRDVVVRAGFGLRAASGQPADRPRALPPPPAWTSPPPARVLTAGAAVDVRGVFAPPAAEAAPARWHLQLASDPRFERLVLDTTVPATQTALEARGLGPGTYYARVSAVDAEQFEGAFGDAAPVAVEALRVVPGGDGRRAAVEVPRGYYCGLNGTPLALVTAPIQLAPARAHRLRCAPQADGQGAETIEISSAQAGPLVHDVRLEPAGFDPAGGMRVLVLRLYDGAGAPVPYASVQATASLGASVGPVREGDARGTYVSTVQWRPGLSDVQLRFVVNGVEAFDYALGP